MKCSDPNCHNCSYHDVINDFYDAIMGTLKMSSQSLITNCKCDFKHTVVPGWNDKVKELHSAAQDACLIWRAIGKPRQGDVFNAMKCPEPNLNMLSENVRKTKKLLLLIVLMKRCVKKIPEILERC